MPGWKEPSRQHPRLSLSSPPSISRQKEPGRRRRRGSRGSGAARPRGPGAERGARSSRAPGRCSCGSVGSTGSRGGAGRAGQPGPHAFPGASPGPQPRSPAALSPPGPSAAAAGPERGHGLPAEPAEQPGGGERRGALPRQAGERPGRLPPLVPAPAPAEAARGAAESLARALRAAGGVAAGDPGHHPGAQAGARRAHPPAAQEGTSRGMRVGAGRGRDKGPCGAVRGRGRSGAGAAVREPPPRRWGLQPPLVGLFVLPFPAPCPAPFPARSPPCQVTPATCPTPSLGEGHLARLPGAERRAGGSCEDCAARRGRGVRAWAVLIHTPPCQPTGVLSIDAPQKKATATTSHDAHSARLAEICLGNPKMVLEGSSGTVEAQRRGKGVSVSVGACSCLPPFRNSKARVQTVWCQTDAEDRALLLEQSHLLHHSLLPSLSSQTQLLRTATAATL